jgi:hypothetical protein
LKSLRHFDARNMRALIWLIVIALAALGRLLHIDLLTVLAEPLALVLLCWVAPPALRLATACIAVGMLAILLIGGIGWALQTLPVFIALWIGWLFARSLMAPHTPLIARAMAAIDGREMLADPAATAYARGVTRLWAGAMIAFALFAALCVAHVHGAFPLNLPSPQFCAVALPAVSAFLFVGEFALRHRLLPQAPRHTLWRFVRDMVHIWPELIGDETHREIPL